MTAIPEKNMSTITETAITPFLDRAYEANTTAALALRLSEQDQFVNLASQVEELLNRANKFIEAANLLEKANGTNGNELNGMAGEISLARNQGQQLVEDALTLLSDPELMTEPDMALKRAELIYLGARVSSSLQSTNCSSPFLVKIIKRLFQRKQAPDIGLCGLCPEKPWPETVEGIVERIGRGHIWNSSPLLSLLVGGKTFYLESNTDNNNRRAALVEAGDYVELTVSGEEIVDIQIVSTHVLGDSERESKSSRHPSSEFGYQPKAVEGRGEPNPPPRNP